MPWGEHFVERAHHRMLSLEPELRDLPYDSLWQPQRPWLLPALVVSAAVHHFVARVRTRFPGGEQGTGEPAEPLFAVRRLFAHRETHREVCLSAPDSPLWTGSIGRPSRRRSTLRHRPTRSPVASFCAP